MEDARSNKRQKRKPASEGSKRQKQRPERRVVAYVEKLERENEELRAKLALPATITATDALGSQQVSLGHVVDNDVPNPLLDVADGLFAGQTSAQPVYVGEASCTAFGDRLLQCVNRRYSTISCNTMPDHVTHPAFHRLLSRDIHLPDQGEARLLICVAQNFIGQNYHLLERKSFFEKFERAYRFPFQPDLLFLCHLFAVLALGELYSTCHTTETDHRVPGTNWFLQAISLLQDLYEIASIEQVQILLLLSFYANALGRIRSAHTYCGIALRLAIGLGLHRSQSGVSTMRPVQRETRRRVWWTLYLFDRMVSSKLGYPLGIRDDDIDVEMPSMDGLSAAEQAEFQDPVHLCAHARLARITGDILSDVYCLQQSSKTTRITFVRRVHRVLNDLRDWEEHLPDTLRLRPESSARSLYTLHMQYHLCIIQTTRPILLHIFRSRFSPASDLKERQSFSQTTMALAEACVQAARKTSQQLSKLRVEGNLAVFGYFDSHYLFSSTLVLIITAVMEPSTATSDLVQTAFSVLRGMANNGNISASDYLNRLERIRTTIASVSNHGIWASKEDLKDVQSDVHQDKQIAPSDPSRAQPTQASRTLGPMLGGDGLDANDPLDDPLIDAFLSERAFELPAEGTPDHGFGQFVHELDDYLLFGNDAYWNSVYAEEQSRPPDAL